MTGVVGQVDAGQASAEEVAVLGGHAGAVGGVRPGGVSGVADERDPALRPPLEGFAVTQDPVLHIARLGRGDQLRQRRREFRGHSGGGLVRVADEGCPGLEGAEHPPLEAVAAFAADRRPAALHRAAVGDAACPFGASIWSSKVKPPNTWCRR